MIIFLLLLAPFLAQADSFSMGLSNSGALKARTKSLLTRAGLGDSLDSGENREEAPKSSFLKLVGPTTSVLIPEGSLAFGKTYLRLLVGDESSPVQIIFSERNTFPCASRGTRPWASKPEPGTQFAEFNRLVTRSGKIIPIKRSYSIRLGRLA